MTLTFFESTSDHRRVDKTTFITQKETYTAYNQIETLDLIKPTFIVANNKNDHSIQKTWNYAYCPDLKRYYFVLSMDAIKGKKMEINCLVDVRMSFLNGAEIPVNVIRNEKIKSNVPDNKFPVDPNKVTIDLIKLNSEMFMSWQGNESIPVYYDMLLTQ